MDYFIVTYRVTVNGDEKYCGEAAIAGSEKEKTANFVNMVASAYAEIYPQSSLISIRILKKKQTTLLGFKIFWQIAYENRKRKSQA